MQNLLFRCYVGVTEDQWRPCSEKYFPYLPSPRPSVHPTGGGGDRHHGRFDPHDPGYYGRHWPITYLHPEPPPNCTDSLASADNSGNRRRNQTTPSTITEKSTTTTDATEANTDNNTTTIIRTRRRRLRTRMTPINNDVKFNRPIYLRKNGVQTTNHTQRSAVRAGKIEQVSKPSRAVPLRALTPSTAAAAVSGDSTQLEHARIKAANGSNGASAQLERARIETEDNGGMIKVPLIAANSSLPMGAEMNV